MAAPFVDIDEVDPDLDANGFNNWILCKDQLLLRGARPISINVTAPQQRGYLLLFK